jgi:TonB family protein
MTQEVEMRLGWIALLGSASVAVASPVFAQTSVTARYARWENQLRSRVSELLYYPMAAGGAAGDVFVAFRIGDDGKPANIVVQSSSGRPVFDRAAVELVSRLGQLGPVPTSDGKVPEVVLKLSYGDPSATVAQSLQLARADNEERLANERRAKALISGATEVAQRH